MHAAQWRRSFFVGIALLIAVWLASSIWGLVEKAHIAVSQAREAQRQYESLEERKAMLEANLAALRSERGQDAAIRTAFGVARPGEEVIVVVPPEMKAPTTTQTWWQKILDWF